MGLLEQFDLATAEPVKPPAKSGLLDQFAEPEQPGFFETVGKGFRAGAGAAHEDVARGAQVLTGQEPKLPEPEAAAPDAKRPWLNRFANFLGTTAGSSMPFLEGAGTGGVVGAGVGGPAAPVTGLLGAAGGGAVMAGLQQVGDTYAQARARGKSHEEAAEIAYAAGSASGAINGISVLLGPVGFAGKVGLAGVKKKIADALFQTFAVQPGVGVGDQAVQNVIAQQTYDPERRIAEGLPQAYAGEVLFEAPATAAIAATAARKGEAAAVPAPAVQPQAAADPVIPPEVIDAARPGPGDPPMEPQGPVEAPSLLQQFAELAPARAEANEAMRAPVAPVAEPTPAAPVVPPSPVAEVAPAPVMRAGGPATAALDPRVMRPAAAQAPVAAPRPPQMVAEELTPQAAPAAPLPPKQVMEEITPPPVAGRVAQPVAPQPLTTPEQAAALLAQPLQATPEPPPELVTPPRKRIRQKPFSFAEILSRSGGIKDTGGELKAMNAELWHKGKPGLRPLVNNESGISWDRVLELAQQEGFLPENLTDRPNTIGIQEAQDLLFDELGGKPVYAENEAGNLADWEATKGRRSKAYMDDEERYHLEGQASDLGVDPAGMKLPALRTAVTDAQVRSTLKEMGVTMATAADVQAVLAIANEQDISPAAAAEQYGERLAIQALNEGYNATPDADYAQDIPFEDHAAVPAEADQRRTGTDGNPAQSSAGGTTAAGRTEGAGEDGEVAARSDERPPSVAHEASSSIEHSAAEGPAQPSDLDRSTGISAYTWSSMQPERGADLDIKAYVSDVNSLYADLLKAAQTDKQREIARTEAERFRGGRKRWQYTLWGKRSRTASTMVTGPAKFNVGRNEKALDSEQRAYGEFQEWRRRARGAAFQAVHDARTPDQVTEDVWSDVKRRIDRTIGNIGGGASTSLVVSNLAGFLQRFAAHGDAATVRRALDYVREQQKRLPRPIFTDRHSVWKLADKASAAAEVAEQAAPEGVVAEWEGASVERDTDRVRIYFPGKPSEVVRADLRGAAWRWSPSNGAWQRQATEAAVQSATRILDKHLKRKDGDTTAATPASAGPPVSDAANADAQAKQGAEAQYLRAFSNSPLTSGHAKDFVDGWLAFARGESVESGSAGKLAGWDAAEAAGAYTDKRATPKDRSIDKIDAGDQRVIPGAEKITDKQLAERKAAQPLRPDAPQKKADEGLFDTDAKKQGSLFRIGSGPTTEAQWTALADALSARLTQLGIRDKVNLRIVSRIRARAGLVSGQEADALGLYLDKLITIAAKGDAMASLDHEAIHAMVDLGLITKSEYRALLDAAQRDKRAVAQVKRDYPKLNATEQGEELVANYFAKWAKGQRVPKGAQTLMERVRDVLKALADAARKVFGNGPDAIDTAATDVLRKIESGEVGARPEGARTERSTPKLHAAWHGSPHDFDRFSTEKIGTGEGHQAFGWGLYFTGSKKVAEHYRNALGGYRDLMDALREEYDQYTEPADAVEAVKALYPHLKEPERRLLEALEKDDFFGFEYPHQAVHAAATDLDAYDPSPETRAAVAALGRLYKVELRPAEDEYLRWDLPASQQSDKVKAALRRLRNGESFEAPAAAWETARHFGYSWAEFAALSAEKQADLRQRTPKTQLDERISGADVYHDLAESLGKIDPSEQFRDEDQRAASLALKAVGIPGIKYPAGSLSGAKSDAHNYVIFDEADVTIEEKYRLVPAPIRNAYDRMADKVMARIDSTPWGKFFDPLIRLGPDFKKLRYETFGHIAQVDRMATKVADSFKGLDPTQMQAAYDYLTTANATPAALPASHQQSIAAVKNEIDQVGRRLVAFGFLPQQTYAGQYLPRIYLRYLLDTPVNTGTLRGKMSDRGYAKARDPNLSQFVRDVVLGEIKDPAYLSARAYAQPMRDLVVYEFLENVAANPQWAYQPSLIQMGGQRVTSTWAREEAQALRKQADYMRDPALAQQARALAQQLDAAADQAGAPPADKTWTQMPETSAYGPLRGMWVKTEIYNDLVASFRMLPKDASWLESWFGVGGAGTKATQVWKTLKVAFNPPSQARNFISNMVALDVFADVDKAMVPVRIAQAIRQIVKDGPAWQVAKQHGVTATTFAAQELGQIERQMIRDLGAKRHPMRVLTDHADAILKAGGASYGFIESIFKTAVIVDQLAKGKSGSDAAAHAHEALFDYSNAPPWVRYMRNTPLLGTFVTYSYKALPKAVETAIKRPWKYAPYIAVATAIPHAIAGMYDVDQEDVDKLLEAMPEFLRRRGGSMLWPFKGTDGKWDAVNMSYYFPWGGFQTAGHLVLDAAKKFGKGEVAEGLGASAEALGSVAIGGGPLTDIIAALATNRDPFTGKLIVDPATTPKEQLLSLLTYVWGMAAPGWVTDTGAARHIWDAMSGKVDAYTGDPKETPVQAFLRLIGVNVYPFEPRESQAANLRRMEGKRDDTVTAMNKAMRDRNLDAEDRSDVRDDYRAKVSRLEQEMREYRKRSTVPPALQ